MTQPQPNSSRLPSELRAQIQAYLGSGGGVEELAEAILAGGYRPPEAGVQIDGDRRRRCGYSEVIYGEGKSEAALAEGVQRLLKTEREVLITRIGTAAAEGLVERYPYTRWNREASTLRVSREALEEGLGGPVEVAVVSAGTTDRRVALEALETLAWMGVPGRLVEDVGVAGPYRLYPHLEMLRSCRSIVVVAGMEAALASVVAGHVGVPVIAVPTSVGYGANLGGLAALLGMLNSCAAHVSVVNIDAGFKGGYLAGLIARPGGGCLGEDRNAGGLG